MSIEVNSLTKIYGEQKAIDNISFSVKKGEIVGFLGPNGAGKSTTMKIVTGYIPPSGGDARICGIRVDQHPIDAKKKIGYLPESNPLYYDMYVREYLGFIAELHKIRTKKKEAVNRAIEWVGLQPESKKRIGQLSKGYKQRVGLAAALIHEPDVLILDEPTSGLDPNQILEIREVIRRLGKEKTVLFSTHIMQEVEAICSRVIIINKGQIVADDQLSVLQQTSRGKQAVVMVSFKEDPEDSLIQELKLVSRAQKLQPGSWNLETAEPESVRKQLMLLSLQHNLNIVSLHNAEDSLEEVFRNLTASSNQA
jgi:ABC-2 type transport system ATP-binding protein